jgi:(5-formylfuran-3-yl)methyl phosphate synthase
MKSSHSPQLLVSVRDATEAVDALDGGADWIDCKEPLAGPLGAVTVDVAREIVQAVAGQCPVSAALGELIDWPKSAVQKLLAVGELCVLKLGLRDCGMLPDWSERWISAFQVVRLAGKDLAAVIYADWLAAQAPRPREVITAALSVGCRFLLVDTFVKDNKSSLEFFCRDELTQLSQLARQGGMTTALAGSLRVADLPHLAGLPLDLVAVRGAVCQGKRTARVGKDRVCEFRSALKRVVVEEKQVVSLYRSQDQIFLDSCPK